MHHFLTFPNRATWEAFGWVPSECGMYAHGPNGEFADVIGDNYYTDDEGNREPRPGFLVNIAGELPAEMEQYALPEKPQHPKRVFA